MSSEVISAVAAALDAQQSRWDGPRLLFVPAPTGLGGQITGRVDVFVLALATGRTAVFPTPADPPYAKTFDIPGPIGRPPVDHTVPPVTIGRDQPEPEVVHHSAAGLSSFGDALRARVADRLRIALADDLALHGAVLAWMRPTPAMAAMVDAASRRLSVTADTLGVHFRRGDKNVETAFVPAAEVNRRIAAIHRIWPFTSVYLASDSDNAPDEIALPPGVSLIFDREEKRYNNANHKMLIGRPDLAQQETEVAYKNIALLCRCGGIVGQNNAHFATLAAAAIIARGGSRERIALIDGRIAEQRSPFLAWRFRSQALLRTLAKRLFPWLTTAARMRRRATKGGG